MLTFVHISDLHIGQDGPAEVDRDRDPREELIEDCRRVTAQLDGEVSGVLISGDIAHSGIPDEYEMAREWIGRLCEELDTAEENVWCVPGNHDFHRAARTDLWRSACAQLRECPLEEIDIHLGGYLASVDKDVLLGPLVPYHEFAAKFECLPEGPVQVWDDDFELEQGLRLRIVGLNTAILADGDEDAEGNGLVLGENAMQFPRGSDDTFILAMWHHPLAWLRDRDKAREYTDSRAVVHLFGHEHSHCLRGSPSTLAISAGALHPKRGTRDWDPRYNFIEIAAAGTELTDGLDLAVISRQWDSSQTRFGAEGGGLEVTRSSFRVGAAGGVETDPEPPEPTPVAVNAAADSYGGDGEQPRGRVANRRRRLALRYATLPYVKRIVIAGELDLLEEDDGDQPNFEQTRDVIARAERDGRLAQLWDAVACEQEPGEMTPNPYDPVGT
jgi:GTPase-associated adaptor domain/Calcineurin-like phosphoesterase